MKAVYLTALQLAGNLNLCSMKVLIHNCVTCHREVLVRNREDLRNIVNYLALCSFATGVEIWVDAVMSTHIHIILFGEKSRIIDFDRLLKMRITKYHRCKYHTRGPLFDAGVFAISLTGHAHSLTAISYVLRNGLHHGVSATPFGYEGCSANYLFRRDLGKPEPSGLITDRKEIAARLPRRAEFPDSFVMEKSGIFLRDSFEELKRVELAYRTPRSFLYQMNRLSSEEWEREQLADEVDLAPVTLWQMEPQATADNVSSWLSNEKGFGFRYDKPTDMSVCEIIDNTLLLQYSARSVYELAPAQSNQIANYLFRQLHIPKDQILRCLAM